MSELYKAADSDVVFKNAYLLQKYIARYLISMKCMVSCANSYYLPTALTFKIDRAHPTKKKWGQDNAMSKYVV